MSIICVYLEQKLNWLPRLRQLDFRLADRGNRSIEFANDKRFFRRHRSLRQMKKDLLLAFDIGTGRVLSALVKDTRKIRALAAKELDQVIPKFGRSQQSPRSWWEGLVFSIRSFLGRVGHSA